MPRWRTLDVAARQAGVSRRTLQRWVKAGRLTAYSVAGDPHTYLDLDAIEELRKPTPKPPTPTKGGTVGPPEDQR